MNAAISLQKKLTLGPNSRIPVAQPVSEQHIRFDLSVISPHHAFGELTQLLLTFPLCFGEDILRLGKAIVIIADDNAALPPAVTALSYGAGSAFPFFRFFAKVSAPFRADLP